MRAFTHLLSLALVLLLGSCNPTQDDVAQPSAPSDDAGLEATLQAYADQVRETTGVPAMGVAVVTAEEGLVALVVTGERVAGSGEAVEPGDLWHIGSCTKAVTAALYARRVERGEAEWGESPLRLRPEAFAGGAPEWLSMPVEAFLTHRSGIGSVPDSFLFTARASSASLPEQRLRWLTERLQAPPGEDADSFAYSNFGYMLVGTALETSETGWEALAGDFLIEAGLEEGEFGFGPPQGDQPQGHAGDPPFPAGQGQFADNPLALGPAGTLHVSLEGWSKFVRLFLTDGGSGLAPESVATLTAPWPDASSEQALGWFVSDSPAGPVIYHAGSNTMWFAQALILPQQGYAILVVTNQGGGMGETAVVGLTQLAMGAVKAEREESR